LSNSSDQVPFFFRSNPGKPSLGRRSRTSFAGQKHGFGQGPEAVDLIGDTSRKPSSTVVLAPDSLRRESTGPEWHAKFFLAARQAQEIILRFSQWYDPAVQEPRSAGNALTGRSRRSGKKKKMCPPRCCLFIWRGASLDLGRRIIAKLRFPMVSHPPPPAIRVGASESTTQRSSLIVAPQRGFPPRRWADRLRWLAGSEELMSGRRRLMTRESHGTKPKQRVDPLGQLLVLPVAGITPIEGTCRDPKLIAGPRVLKTSSFRDQEVGEGTARIVFLGLFGCDGLRGPTESTYSAETGHGGRATLGQLLENKFLFLAPGERPGVRQGILVVFSPWPRLGG